ncbi:uncharacterized protein, partial [Asterias amurensis]|uniref:uncharacterized protein n=1 Tax=Asterias amurensis TaxID=7602 RepID=UPI003AB87FC2
TKTIHTCQAGQAFIIAFVCLDPIEQFAPSQATSASTATALTAAATATATTTTTN